MKRILSFVFSFLLFVQVLLMSSCNCFHGNGDSKTDSIVANISYEILQKYLPYATVDTCFFVSANGQVESFICNLNPPFSDSTSSLNFFNVYGDGDWSVGLAMSYTSQSKFVSIRASASGAHFRDGVEYDFTGYVSDSTIKGERSFLTILPSSESIVALYPELLMNKTLWSSTSDLPSGSYIKATYNKGLTEFSIDGQEIWRLVEKE